MNEENKKLLDEITGLRQSNTSALNIRNAVKMDPERAARDIQLAEQTKLPVDTVQRNRDEVEQREYINSVGNLEGFPALQKFMSDPRNASVAIDDIENLKQTEKVIQDDIGVWSTFDNWAGGTLNRVNTLTGNFIELVGNMGDEIRTVFDDLGIPNPGIVVGDDGVSFSRDIPVDMPSIITETGKAVSEGEGYDYVPQFTWERLKGDLSVRNLSGYVAEQGVQSIPDMLAAMFTLPAYIASRTEEIAEERVANDERKDVELADISKALVPALGVSLIERLGAKVTFGTGGVRSPLDALKATGAAGVIEGGTEFTQEGVEYLGATLGTAKDVNLSEMFDQQLAGLVAGSGMGAGIRATTSTVEALASRTSRRVETNLESLGEQQLIDNIVEYAQSSKLRGRMADRYADFLRGTNSPREVFITEEGMNAVKESGVELPPSLTKESDGTGVDATLDVATFATEIAGNPELMETLRPHVRMSSESLTLNEMEQHDLELEKMVQRAEQSKELKAEADRIYDEIKDQIVATGRQSESTARYSARIIPAYVTTKAEALGLTPTEVYERMGLKVTGPATEINQGKSFEQVERNSTADEFKAAINDARAKNPNVPSVAEYDVSEYENMNTFLLDEGRAGYAIESDGTLVGVFKSPDSTLENALGTIVPEAIANGATRLDAFEGFLTEQYAKYGFVEVDRAPWDEQHRPEGWTDEMGTPDMVYMELRNERSNTTETSIPQSVFNQEGIRRSDGETGRNLQALENAPSVEGIDGPIEGLVNVAERYAADNGIDLYRQSEYVDVDPELATRIADAYEQMEHNPSDPAVKEAYENLIQQTMAQYQALVDAGYEFWFIDTSRDDNLEYLESPWNAMRDIAQNQQMGVFPTNEGFGTDAQFDADKNPLLADTGLMWPVGGVDGEMQPVMANDLFRAVHDAFGYGLEGAGFRARGEENAWQAHSRLFTGSALGAITSETRGQNSWFNYGPHGEKNRNAKIEDTIFADQKTGLMPEWTWMEGRAGDMKSKTFNQSAELSRNSIGMYSAIEKAILNMSIQGWSKKSVKGKTKEVDAEIEALSEQRAELRDQKTALVKQNRDFEKANPDLTDEQLDELDAAEDALMSQLRELDEQISEKVAQRDELATPRATAKEILQKLTKEPGIKAEELEWTGLEELLFLRGGKLSREDVLELAINNRVQVEEIETGERADAGGQPFALDWQEQGERLIAEFNSVKYELIPDDTEPMLYIDGDPFELNSTNIEDVKIEAFEMAQRHRGDYETSTGTNVSGPLEWGEESLITDPNWYDGEFNRDEPEVRESALRNVALTLDLPEVDEALRNDDLDELANIIEADYYDDLDLQLDIVSERYTAENFPSKQHLTTRNGVEYRLVQDYEGEFTLYIDGVDYEMYSRDLEEAKEDAVEIISNRAEVRSVQTPTKWDRYVMPGDVKDYREIKLTLPNSDQVFLNNIHFDEPNILAFLRVTTRPGNKFFIDELQSDWHQQGRKKGYRSNTREERSELNDMTTEMDERVIDILSTIAEEIRPYIDDDRTTEGMTDEEIDALPNQQEFLNETDIYSYMIDQIDDAIGLFDPMNETGSEYMEGLRRLRQSQYNNETLSPLLDELFSYYFQFNNTMEQLNEDNGKVPDAPFKGDAWLNLALKRAVVKAVEEGADSLAWPDSQVMSKRWGYPTSIYEMQYDKKMVGMVKKLTGAKPEFTENGEQRFWSVPLSQELKNRVADESFPLFQFAGQFSETSPNDQLQRAVSMEDAEVSMTTIRRETGWFKGTDNQWRYEISDDKASFKSDATDSMRKPYRDLVESSAEVSKRGGNLHVAEMRYKGSLINGQGQSATAAKNALIDTILLREGESLPGGIHGFNGLKKFGGTTIGEILNHPELFKAYPFIADYKIKAMTDFEPGDYGAFYADEQLIEVNTERTDDEILSTVLHEIQHVIQNYEGFATGGNMSIEFTNAVQDAVGQMSRGSQRTVDRWVERNAGKMDKAERAAQLAQNGLMYQSMQKLIDYANHDRPSSVFRHVRNQVQWIYTETIQKNDELRVRGREIERMFYDIPSRGTKRNQKIGEIAFATSQLLRDAIPDADFKLFKEDERTLDSMTKALRRDANKAQQPLKKLRSLKRDATAAKTLEEKTKYKTPYQVYRALAGEIEARTTQARQNLTPEEREARDPKMDMDTPRQEAIVVMGSLELRIPNAQANSERPQGPRGSITFTPNNDAIIRLGQASDLSTFLHESGHLFLEMEGKFAKEFGITEDQQTILDWLEVQSFDDVKVEHHEKFARGFEAYTREGKAPSLALRDAFSAFRRWLTRIYRDIMQLDVQLTDDIRGVMDRMLATEREIEEALNAPNYEEMFRSKEQAGMTDEEWAKYQKTLEKRRNAATETIDEKLLKEYTRRKTQEWREEKAPLMEQELERLSPLPVYQIMGDAREFPMDFDMLKEMVGVEKLPGKFIGLAKKGGIDPQEYAETYGYKNVSQMYNAIVDAQPLKQAADQAAEALMIQKYGDILNDGSIEAEVREAVHNEEQASLLLQELNALKPPRAQAINTQQIKLNARNTIAKMKYGEIKPNKYNRAEIRAAQNAARATSKEEQYKFKLQQVVNHHLYREAVAAREAMIKQRKYIRGVQKREYSGKQVSPEYITNMKLVANMYDMRQKPAQTMAIEQLLTWYETQMNDPNDFAQLQLLDVNLIRALAARKNGELESITLPTFDDLTAEDLRSTYDMLRHMRHVGGQMSDAVKAELQQTYAEIEASIDANGGRDVKDVAGLPSKHTDLKRKLSHVINLIPSLRNLVRKLDGFETGPMYEHVYRKIEEAQARKIELGAEMYERFSEELSDLHKIGLNRKDHKTYLTDDGMEIDITSEHRFMMALYWGTESSREAIRDGWGLTDNDVSRILADMPDEQVDVLNKVWKVNETMWPDLSAASVRLYGVAPPKLEPTPFNINGIPVTGGHMRLFYDSSKHEMQSERDDAAKMATIVPSRAGSLYERVGSGGNAPMLDVNNMIRAIEDNVHFVAFAEVGRQVAGIMNNNNVKATMERKHGRGFRKALIQNLENITSNRPAQETLPLIPQVSRLLRKAATFKYLSYSLRNAVQGLGAIPIAMEEVGTAGFVGGLTRFASPNTHQETIQFVQQRSQFMKQRSSLVNREAAEHLNKITMTNRAGHALDVFIKYGFTPQTIIDSLIAYPVWIARYEKSMQEHGDESRAASDADTSVAESVGSGSDLHLGGVFQQNNTEFVKTMTVFGSWFNNYFQRVYRSTRGGTSFGNRGAVQALVTTPFIVAVLSSVLIMDTPEDDSDEGWLEWMLKRYGSFMAGTVPLLRDIGAVMGGFTPKTPLASGAEIPARVISELKAISEDRQTPLKTTSDLINITTTVVPVPGAGNVTRVLNFIDSDAQGNESGSAFAKTYQALVEGPNRN